MTESAAALTTESPGSADAPIEATTSPAPVPRSGPLSEIEDLLEWIHARHADNLEGAVADYIPELAKVAPDQFGAAIATQSGDVLAIGDAGSPFTVQSISKVFTFAMLLKLDGREETYRLVGVQPSSDPFNSIILDPDTNRPFNPMINAGAIAVAARLYERLGKGAFDTVMEVFGLAAGRPLELDEAVFESERETGHRNRAIGHLLRAAGAFEAPVDEALDLYFRQCSVRVTAADVAMMGATLANLGVNPRTRQDVFGVDAVRDALSVMFTCGMYDGAGSWATQVGVPAKSGVGGGIMAVVNRQIGVGVFSPRLDQEGNSVRGKLCCIDLADALGLHSFDATNPGSSFLRGLTKRA